MDKNISASQFKIHCLAILVPIDAPGPPNLLGSVHYKRETDLLAPIDESWKADQ